MPCLENSVSSLPKEKHVWHKYFLHILCLIQAFECPISMGDPMQLFSEMFQRLEREKN